MKDQQPRDHHYVPQGYLRGFTETANVLFVTDKTYGKVRQTSPKGIAYIKDYYTVDTIDEKDSSEVEEKLSIIESTCLPIMAKLEKSTDLTNADRADLAIYIALQYGRTPGSRERLEQVYEAFAANELRIKLVESAEDPHEYDEIVQLLHKERPDLEIPSQDELLKLAFDPTLKVEIDLDNGTFVTQFFEISEEIAEGLLKLRWHIYHAPSGSSFITTDNPIGIELHRDLRPFESHAILMSDATRYYPLNAKTCLVMGGEWAGRTIEHTTLSKLDVRKINKLLHKQAHKYVISGSRNLLASVISSS